jgi:hypothetical protein
MQRFAVFVSRVVVAVAVFQHAFRCVSCQSATRGSRYHSTTASVVMSLTAVPTLSKNNGQPCAAGGASDVQFDDAASRTIKSPIVLEGRIVRTQRLPASDADPTPATNAIYAVTRILKGKLAAQASKSKNVTVVIGPFVDSAAAAGPSKSGDRCAVKLPTLPPLATRQQQQQLFIAFASLMVPAHPASDGNGENGIIGNETQPFYRISGQLVAATKPVVKDVQTHSCLQCGRYSSIMRWNLLRNNNSVCQFLDKSCP